MKTDANFFDTEVENALTVLRRGGIILYPTDTVWGIGCDATNITAVNKIYQLKKRPDKKAMIILVAGERDVMQYVAAPDPAVFEFIEEQNRPTTIIYEHAIGLPENLTADDGSIAIRIVQDDFCRHLVKRLRKPIVSTSANSSGMHAPKNFSEISMDIINGVDHVVKWRQDDKKESMPSQVIKWDNDGTKTIIRK
jgi:L-threonylcarbamoyladenylate synthase